MITDHLLRNNIYSAACGARELLPAGKCSLIQYTHYIQTVDTADTAPYTADTVLQNRTPQRAIDDMMHLVFVFRSADGYDCAGVHVPRSTTVLYIMPP